MAMAERRKQRKQQASGEDNKEETAVAKYLRFNCPTKSTNMMGHSVDYFVASKAVETLLESNWATGKKGTEILFTTRESVVAYCNRLLQKQYFHRALKVIKKRPDREGKREKLEPPKEEEKKGKREKERKKDGDKKDKEGDAKRDARKEDEPGSPKKKKDAKRRMKLEPHDKQIFVDGNEVFVWIYDPVHPKTFIMGLILVIAVIAATLFPLWPAEMRVGVYYLSVAAGCFIGGILFLAVARCILFMLIWLLTGGRHHFWLLPNLTADVGFLDSFRPLYTHERQTGTAGAAGAAAAVAASSSMLPESAAAAAKSDAGKRGSTSGTTGEACAEAVVPKTLGPSNGTDSDDDDGDGGGPVKADNDDDYEEEEEEEDDEAGGKRGTDEGSDQSNGNDFEVISQEEIDGGSHGDGGDGGADDGGDGGGRKRKEEAADEAGASASSHP
ncbi:translocation protein SEC62 isoform X1 [Lethenteron reissneri]|uniref:translocation protein SEC62 isoform X1 n=1 Tax=Lethenteron reissneri TaxID=7753 RepID=UPI002AB5F370|nr:translocation protein SEC62 isoform X1 [Lethenteron reissneri]